MLHRSSRPGRPVQEADRPRPDRQGHRHRPEADRAHPAVEPGHLHQGVRPDPRHVRQDAGGAHLRLRAGSVLVQRHAKQGGGRCEACEGAGVREVEMHFLPNVFVTCEVCRGQALQRRHAARPLQGQDDRRRARHADRRGARAVHQPPGRSHRSCETLVDVGLGYIPLGQAATTLSGGEAQRVKLARELAKRQTGRTLYLLDEPTTGLHFEDVHRAARGAAAAGRIGQHRGRHRAQPRRHQDGRLDHRPRPRGRRARAAR